MKYHLLATVALLLSIDSQSRGHTYYSLLYWFDSIVEKLYEEELLIAFDRKNEEELN
jgi:hypothetical protein